MVKTQTKQRSKTPAAKLKKHVSHKAKLALVPHKKNHYRPHFVRRYSLGALVVLVAVMLGGYNLATTGEVLGGQTNVTDEALLSATNQARSNEGHTALQLDEQLSQAAALKAQDMFAQQYWSHDAPDGTTPWEWFDEAGYSYVSAGENLAKNFSNSNAIVRAWLDSPSHRSNVLGEMYQDVGFAVAEGELDGQPTSIVVALYGAKQVRGASLVATPPAQTVGFVGSDLGVLSRLGVAVQSMTPAALGAIVLLFVATVIALAAHAYRQKLPKPLRTTWYRHHGAIKALGMASLIVMIVAVYSGGQL